MGTEEDPLPIMNFCMFYSKYNVLFAYFSVEFLFKEANALVFYNLACI
jgi:hypothetical protein